jgi:hypothetical protein
MKITAHNRLPKNAMTHLGQFGSQPVPNFLAKGQVSASGSDALRGKPNPFLSGEV